ncbi:MAG: hypothetical protein CMI95_00025 [Pelagibacteraceae bacterium]|nr:hypothetical protein [Pelagibacteraceae bacterium]PPR50637.1 MAG: hypothetical protein CFH20_00881 [Alphaproteobacteria bacterium MarineAlpha5_Bin10]
MTIFVQLGIYSNKGADGIINGESDRKAAMEKMLSSVGAKLLEYHITRGKYDFVLLSEANSFESVAACALKAKASGTLSEAITLEAVDLNKVREMGRLVDFSPPK